MTVVAPGSPLTIPAVASVVTATNVKTAEACNQPGVHLRIGDSPLRDLVLAFLIGVAGVVELLDPCSASTASVAPHLKPVVRHPAARTRNRLILGPARGTGQ